MTVCPSQSKISFEAEDTGWEASQGGKYPGFVKRLGVSAFLELIQRAEGTRAGTRC